MTSVVMSRPGARNIRFRPLRQVRRWVVDSKDLLFIDLTRDPKLADASADIDVAVKVIRSEGLSHLRRWLATLNGENYSVEWWSHNCTAKNPLSSPLIMRALDVMACISLIDAQPLRDVVICGATPGQQRSIEAHYGINKFCYNISSLVGTYVKKLFSLAKCILQGMIVWANFHRGYFSNKLKRADIALITYVDGSNRSAKEPYFGTLAADIKERDPNISVIYVAYVYAPYRLRLKEIPLADRDAYVPIWGLLKASDYFWALTKIVRAKTTVSLVGSHTPEEVVAGIDLYPVLHEILLNELATGYYHHLLTYRAACRMADEHFAKRVIYPFENKPVEKCLLLGLKRNTEITTIGYQHSSITPRHFGLVLESAEKGVVPLPNKIITLGAVTANWLIQKGSFAPGHVSVGCALRNRSGASVVKGAFSARTARLLLALSSSRSELIDSIRFVKKLFEMQPGLDIAVRTHPNFPLSILPSELLLWVKNNLTVFCGTDLQENFEWADIVLYISSTVALESLQKGIPVIRLDLDLLDSDPLIGDPPFRWIAPTPLACVEAVEIIADMSDGERRSLVVLAREYTNAYMVSQWPGSVEQFLG